MGTGSGHQGWPEVGSGPEAGIQKLGRIHRKYFSNGSKGFFFLKIVRDKSRDIAGKGKEQTKKHG